MAYYVNNYDQNTTAKFEAAKAEVGLKQITFTPEQAAKLNELSGSVREEWVKKYSDKFDSQALFDYTEKLFAQ